MIQAMKNRQSSNQIRVFNKQEDVDRIYGLRTSVQPQPMWTGGKIYNHIEKPAWTEEVYNNIEKSHLDLLDRSRIESEQSQARQDKIQEEEQKLKLAQKLHQCAVEEMELERLKLEKLLNEKKKLLQDTEPSLPPPQIEKKKEQEKEEEKEDDSFSCVVCFDAKRQVICSPCLHVALCMKCSTDMKQCPICMDAAEMKRIFLV